MSATDNTLWGEAEVSATADGAVASPKPAGPLWLRIDAPFVACRPMVAGWYRPAAAFLSHSAVYGLLLNLAGIESRLWEHEPGHDGKTPASLVRDDLPRCEIALGRVGDPPRVVSLYQQLHNYPVGASGMPPELSKGTKNNITPVRRELLHRLHAAVVVRGNDELTAAIRRGLAGNIKGRYGLPFLGDNNGLPDRLEETDPRPAHWYERIAADQAGRPRPGTERLTIRIDRQNMAGTVSALFAPTDEPDEAVSDAAWVSVGPEATEPARA